MVEWSWVEFRELAASDPASFAIGPFGSKITKENYVSKGVPVVRGVNLARGIFVDDEFVYISDEKADELASSTLAPGDLVFTHRGTIGQVSMIPRRPRFDRYILSSSQVKARLNQEKAVPEFYYYWFRSPFGQHSLLSNASTVGVPGIASPLSTIRSIKVPYPPIEVQRGIAEILGALDEKIAANEQTANSCDKLAEALLDQLLAEDPEVKKISLGEVAKVNPRTVKPVAGGYLRYIDISCVSAGRIDWPERLSWDKAPGRARRGVSPGDTIWSTVRPGRRSYALILDKDPEIVVSTGFVVLTPVKVGPAFLYEIVKRDAFVQYLENVAEGSAYPAVRPERFASAIIPLPSAYTLQRFEDAVMPLRSRAHAADQESRTLAQLRDTLLPKLMSGELRVRDAEKAVEEAL